MTDSIKLTTVTASIATESITVTNAAGASVTLAIRDISALTNIISAESCPLLTPRPAQFVTGLTITRDTFGADAAYKTVKYMLNYLFFFCPLGQGATLYEKFDDMVTAAAVILNYFGTHTNLSGATDILPGVVEDFEPVINADGALYHGCGIPFAVTQFMET